MAQVFITLLVVGLVLALAGAVLYYSKRAESSANDAAVTELAKDLSDERAAGAEDSAAQRNRERFEAAKERAKNATLDSAVRDWIAAGKLWRNDPDRGGNSPGGSGALPSGGTAGPAGR